MLQEWLTSPHGGAASLRGAGAESYLPVEHGGYGPWNLVALRPRLAGSVAYVRILRSALSYIVTVLPGFEHRVCQNLNSHIHDQLINILI